MKNQVLSLMSRVGFVGVCLALAAFTANAESAIFWQFKDSPIATKGGTPTSAEALGANGIRVKAISGEQSAYLSLYGGADTGWEALGDVLYVDKDTGWIVDPLFAGLGTDYATDGVKFMIELGNYNFDLVPDQPEWSVLAYSSLAEYSALRNAEMIVEMADYAKPAVQWDGGSYTSVPEPTGGMLTLFGLAMLALRRRRGV